MKYFALFILSLCLKSCVSQTKSLGSYKADPSLVSVSGISAGAIFSVQFHVAFSSEILGVGVVAGVPYYCAQGSLSGAELCMYTPYMTNVNKLIDKTDEYSDSGDIDDTSNMVGDRVYVFDGTRDTVVNPDNGKNIVEYYQNYGASIYTEFGIAAEHCMPTVDYGNPCTTLRSPYISACDYNGAYILLNFIYGDLVEPTGTVSLTGDFYEFDQTEFISGVPSNIAMDTIGFAYVPSYCQTNAGCKLHLALHGCKQGRGFIDDEYAKNSGYNEVAELNNIIILYPQAVRSMTVPYNPNGCLDWWGYTDANYANKNGPQMDAIHQMMQKILS